MPEFDIKPDKRSDLEVEKAVKTLTLQNFLTRLAMLCMLPLLVLAAYLAFNHIRTLQVHTYQDADRQVRNISTAIDDQIRAQIAVLQILSESALIDDPSRWHELYDLAQSFGKEFGGNVVFADNSMQMLFNTRTPFGTPLPKLPIPSGHAAAPAALETGKPSVGDSFFGPIAKEKLVAVAVPVSRGSHMPFLLLGIIETRLFQRLIDNVALSPEWSLIIVDGQDNVMAHCDSHKHASDHMKKHSQRFVAKSKISQWSVVVDVPEAAYSAPIVKIGGAIAIGILFAVAAGFLGGRVFGQRLTQAVRSLTESSSIPQIQPKIFEIEAVRISLRNAFAAKEMSEGALKEREFLNKTLIKYLPLKIFVKDSELNYILCNDLYAKDLGIEPDKIMGKTDYDLHPKELADEFRAIDSEVMENGAIKDWEEKIHSHNKEIWIHIIKTPFRSDNGDISGVMGIFEDITERKRVEERVQRNQQILQLFIEHAPAAIAMLDTNMRYITVSRRFLIDYAIEGQEIVGRSHYEVFPEIPERWKEIHNRCLMGNTERCEEDPFPRANGKLEWICWEIRPWFEQTGKVGGIILFSEVVTERVEAAERLKESEAKFRDLFQKHAAVKLIIDPENGNIIDANEAAEKFYGWSGEQLRRMRIQDINILPPEKLQEEIEKVKKQQRIHFEFRHRQADGSIKDVAVYSSKINIQGKDMLHSIIHDISESKRAEKEQEQLREQLAQVQKMESVGQLAGGVAHDYNNMLSVILGYSELVMEKLAPDDPLRQDLTEIIGAARRSTHITRQLLAFARKQTIHPVILDLNEAIEDILKMLRRLIGEDIDLAWLPRAGLWPVKMDASQIDQILANLCINARDAIEGVGKITIETSNAIFDEAYCADHLDFVPGDFAMLAVSDDGSGIDKDTLDRIFEPFFTTKGVGQGTGLGLATVYGIVKQNNGFINVYSEPGKGTTFRIYLPRHLGKKDEIRTDKVMTIPRGRGETVLLVEDEEAIRKMAQKILEKMGYQVLSASTPTEALHLAEGDSKTISLLITDVVLPEMNGRDLANRLQIFCPDLKVLFMSGYTSNVIVHRGVLDDGVNFIPKPFSQDELALKVNETLDRIY